MSSSWQAWRRHELHCEIHKKNSASVQDDVPLADSLHLKSTKIIPVLRPDNIMADVQHGQHQHQQLQQPSLPAQVLRNLADKLYDKRKLAALEVNRYHGTFMRLPVWQIQHAIMMTESSHKSSKIGNVSTKGQQRTRTPECLLIC